MSRPGKELLLAIDHVFTQFYPILRAARPQK
jgi:hypothetical protein